MVPPSDRTYTQIAAPLFNFILLSPYYDHNICCQIFIVCAIITIIINSIRNLPVLPGQNIPSPSLSDHPTIFCIFLSRTSSIRTKTGDTSYVNLRKKLVYKVNDLSKQNFLNVAEHKEHVNCQTFLLYFEDMEWVTVQQNILHAIFFFNFPFLSESDDDILHVTVCCRCQPLPS